MTTDSTSPAGIDLDAITKRARRVYPKRGWDGGEAERALPVVTEDVPALVAEVLRLRALRDDIADAFDGLVMKAWRATGETHEPPANVAALLARVAWTRDRLVAGRESDATLRKAVIALTVSEAETVAKCAARVAAARREGAEAMREACAEVLDGEAAELRRFVADEGNVAAEYARIARDIRHVPLPEAPQ